MIERNPRGRPKSYSRERALEAAMRAFWASGYDGASIDALCREMGMPRSSLYQQFGDKEGLFLAAVGFYADTRLAPVSAALGPSGTLTQDLTSFLEAVIALATEDSRSLGCLISCVLADAAGSNQRFRTELQERFGAMERRIEERLRAAGWSESNAAAPAEAAGMMAAVARGVMVRARAGRGVADLRPVASAAVRATVSLSGR